MERSDAYRRLARVRDEFEAARLALAYTLAQMQAGVPINGPQNMALPEMRLSARHLEVTYLLRLYAEYEGILMDYWLGGMRRRTRPQMKVLMDRIASNQTMSAGNLFDAHRVRDFRNDIVHHNVRDPRLTFRDCASRLGTYLRWLPVRW